MRFIVFSSVCVMREIGIVMKCSHKVVNNYPVE